jgi:hypothetical protein
VRKAVTLPHAVQQLARYSYIGKVFPHHTNDERGRMVGGVLISLNFVGNFFTDQDCKIFRKASNDLML